MLHRIVGKLAALSVLNPSAAHNLRAASHGAQHQADLQIKTLEITTARSNLSIRVVIYSDNDHEARDARLIVLLPAAVGVQRLAEGCSVAASPTAIPSLRATISCDLGAIAGRGYREVGLSTTLPPDPSPRRFGVFAYSATPDPRPGNNYAERTIP